MSDMSDMDDSQQDSRQDDTASMGALLATLETRIGAAEDMLAEMEAATDATDELAAAAQGIAEPGPPAREGEAFEAQRREESFRLMYRGTDGYENHVGVKEGKVWFGREEKSEGTPAFDFYSNSFEITEETYGWIDYDITAETWTMNTGNALPTTDSSNLIVGLFRIGWDGGSSKIDGDDVEIYHTGDVDVGLGGGGAVYSGAWSGSVKAANEIIIIQNGRWVLGSKEGYLTNWPSVTTEEEDVSDVANDDVYVYLKLLYDSGGNTVTASIEHDTTRPAVFPSADVTIVNWVLGVATLVDNLITGWSQYHQTEYILLPYMSPVGQDQYMPMQLDANQMPWPDWSRYHP